MSAPAVDAPTSGEREALASMRDELLRDDWAYWHDDIAILYLNRIIGDEYPPYLPVEMRDDTYVGLCSMCGSKWGDCDGQCTAQREVGG